MSLRDYQGNNIPIVGHGQFRIKYKEFSGHLPLVVIEGRLPSLLGLDWFNSLGLGISGVNVVQNTDIDILAQEFPSVFDGKLGMYTGKPVSFNLDPAVAPICLKPRRIPFALKAKVNAELDKLIAQGVLEPVDFLSGRPP